MMNIIMKLPMIQASLFSMLLMLLQPHAVEAACTHFKPSGAPPSAANRYNCHINANHCLGVSTADMAACGGYQKKSRFFSDEPNGVELCQGMPEALDYCNDVVASIGADSVITQRVVNAAGTRTKFKIRKNFNRDIGVDQDGTATLYTHGFLIIEGPGNLANHQVNLATDIITMYPVAHNYVGLEVDEDELDAELAKTLGEPGVSEENH